MMLPRALPAFVLVLMLLPAGREAWAQLPEPSRRERPGPPDAARRHFEAGRYEEAVEAFEVASRQSAGSLPAETLRRWGTAASEAGRPLAAYVRLRQYLARESKAADREALEERIGRAREALLAGAAQFSRMLASAERRPDEESWGERYLVRLAARDGEVSLEGLSGFHIDAPFWRRAEEIPIEPYVDFVRRLLDVPVILEDFPAQLFDANASGPRRVVTIRLVIGDEERRLEALRGEPYDRLKEVVGLVLEFARWVPPRTDFKPKAPPKPGTRPR